MFFDKILVVDDDPRIIRSVKMILKEYEVVGVQSGEEAIRKMTQLNTFSLILLDVFIPDVNGLSVLSQIRKINKDIAVIIMTAYGSMDIAVQALRHRANDFLEKPFSVQDLKDKIYTLLKNRSDMDKFARSDDERIDRVRKFVERNYVDVSLGHVASEMCLSPKYVSRMFKNRTKVNFRDYKLGLKMDNAKKLLNMSSLSVDEISSQLGYMNPESFMRIFKKYTKFTPTQYRRKSRQHKSKKE